MYVKNSLPYDINIQPTKYIYILCNNKHTITQMNIIMTVPTYKYMFSSKIICKKKSIMYNNEM